MYEHIEYQLLGAAAYGVYALVHLSPRYDSGSKRRVLMLGYAPALLAAAVFLSQFLLELALLDAGKVLPTALAGFYQVFYANGVLFAQLSGLLATVYLLLHGSAILAARAAVRPKRQRNRPFSRRRKDRPDDENRRRNRRRRSKDEHDNYWESWGYYHDL